MANTSAKWLQAEHITYQLSSPSCSTRTIQKSLFVFFFFFFFFFKSGEWTISRKKERKKKEKKKKKKRRQKQQGTRQTRETWARSAQYQTIRSKAVSKTTKPTNYRWEWQQDKTLNIRKTLPCLFQRAEVHNVETKRVCGEVTSTNWRDTGKGRVSQRERESEWEWATERASKQTQTAPHYLSEPLYATGPKPPDRVPASSQSQHTTNPGTHEREGSWRSQVQSGPQQLHKARLRLRKYCHRVALDLAGFTVCPVE